MIKRFWELFGLPSVSFRYSLKFSHSSIDPRPFFSQLFSSPSIVGHDKNPTNLISTFLSFRRTSLSLHFRHNFYSLSFSANYSFHSRFLFHSYFSVIFKQISTLTFIFINIFTFTFMFTMFNLTLICIQMFTFIFSTFLCCSTPAACCHSPSRSQTRRGAKLFSRLRN